jgi:hypothetical protein
MERALKNRRLKKILRIFPEQILAISGRINFKISQ